MSGSITVESPPPNSTLHSHLALIIGHVRPAPRSGSFVTVASPYHPPQSFPVHSSGRFKALAPLNPGPNDLTIIAGDESVTYPVAYEPQPADLPIALVIIAGRDSQLRYDDVKPTTVDDAVRRFRMAAYLWQAYTEHQMMKQGFGPRTFQFDEENGEDTRTRAGGHGRVAKVTLVRSKYSVAEIRDTNRAQQNKGGKANGPGLFEIARNAVDEAPEFRGRGKGLQVAALILDATVDHKAGGLIVGHAALGACGDRPLAIFGSHTTFSWPSCIEEVVPCFMDQRPVDTRYVGIDCEGKTYGMAANVGIGAMMHEVGHLLSCPHQTSGVMLRDYVRLHKSFVAVDPDDRDECNWHRLDTLRFLAHPSFGVPWDPPRPIEQPKGPILVTASIDSLDIFTPNSAIFAIEYRSPGKETAEPYVDLLGRNAQNYAVPRNTLNNTDRITVLTSDGGKLDDFKVGGSAFPTRPGQLKSPLFGKENGQRYEVPVPPNLQRITVHHGMALDGIEFSPGGLLGKRGGRPSTWDLNHGEQVIGFNVRHGAWMDGIQFVTTQRTSPWFGNSDGGGPGESRVPAGYRLSGVYGNVTDWIQGVGFEYEQLGQQQWQGHGQQQQQQQWPGQQGQQQAWQAPPPPQQYGGQSGGHGGHSLGDKLKKWFK
ncbi:hypothetical protein VHUM_03523 [Vanrija humicola]|uniref:Jacalin-type lectin domain-containing protein n=1 Tax=Vanrija humicola TaxID=5417 RepID=A0A7D8ZI24_VANHU|nr:hypothetical protein VHUM_03523 [Vanrija humicola]